MVSVSITGIKSGRVLTATFSLLKRRRLLASGVHVVSAGSSLPGPVLLAAARLVLTLPLPAYSRTPHVTERRMVM